MVCGVENPLDQSCECGDQVGEVSGRRKLVIVIKMSLYSRVLRSSSCATPVPLASCVMQTVPTTLVAS